MTDRLYYADPYLREFDATIRRIESRGGRTSVTLDRTAFYPTSGGQPFDTGSLGPFRVVDVVDEDDGTISHVLEAASAEPAAPSPGAVVHGAIDWPRRFDHMQQHTGQHVLSAAFERLFKIRTVSFHLGADVSTIDLGREASPAEIAAAEQEANRVVWDNRPVTIRFASAEEAAALPLRKEPARGGTLRLIDVAEFDLSACGGTHVSRTGAIGVIAVSRWERFRGGQRLEFVCGGRALRAFRVLRDAVTASVRLLSVLPEEVPAAVERLQLDMKEQKRTHSAQQLELARYRADEIAAAAEPIAGRQLVVRVVDADATALKAMATAIASRPGFVVALFSSSSPTLAVIARSDGLTVSAQAVLSALVAKFGGRGGGRPELAQGGGLVGAPEDIMSAVRDVVAT
ncbi:MAG TPA: DHHA1 domain-containing protein [Vicinamibacterales bacterium]|nr:DHHA1 domain-containing protein [Vicinamibacterales bacterium]